MSSSTKSLRVSWDRLTSKALGSRRKREGKVAAGGGGEPVECGEMTLTTTAAATTNVADALDMDDATSAPPPNVPPPVAPPPPARPAALAPGVTAVVASSSSSTSHDDNDEDDDKGAVFVDAVDTMLHPDAHPDGGLALADRRLLDAQRAAVVDLLKEFGRSLLLGRLDLMALSLPVRMFEPRSYLQKLTDAWTHPRFLEEASRPELAGDAVERIKLVATWFVAGLQHAFQSWRKPFNPILGETWAARLGDGSEIFLEQTSHHPPVSAFQLVGPGRRYVFSGLSEPAVGLKGVDVKMTARGARSIVFADDGLRIHMTFPAYLVRGVLSGGSPRAEMQGKAVFVAPEAGVAAEIVFGKSTRPEHRGGGGIGGGGGGCSPLLLQRSDTVTGSVYRLVGGSFAAADGSSSVRGGGGGGSRRGGGDGGGGSDSSDSDGGDNDDGGDSSDASEDPFAAADAAAEARRRQQRQRQGRNAAASSSMPSLFASAGRSSSPRRGAAAASTTTAAGGWGGGSSSLSLISFASALNNLSGVGGNDSSASLSAAAATTNKNNPSSSVTASGNDPSTHAGGAARGETIATCSGNWLSHLDWDGERAWTLAEEVQETWEPLMSCSPSCSSPSCSSPSSSLSSSSASAVRLPLPSDAGNRSDLRALVAAFDAAGDGGITADPAGVAVAQRAKEVLEVAQRADAKLRKEGRGGGGGGGGK